MRLILLPGMDGTGILLQPLVEKLNGLSPSILSYPGDLQMDYAQLTDYVQMKLPSEEPFFLLAESYSGRVAFDLAQRNIPNLQGIIFVASFLSNPRPILLTLVQLLPLSLLFRVLAPDWILRLFVLGPDVCEETILMFRAAIHLVKDNILAKRLRDICLMQRPNKSISIPCYYLQANQDRLVTERSFTEMAKTVPLLVKHEISGAHLLIESNPKDCANVIRSILRSSANKNSVYKNG